MPPAPEVVNVRCSVRGVTKAFGGTQILRGVDLDIDEGSFAVLVGPSGCGKSTLLRLVAGLESADSGTIRLKDRDVTSLPPGDRDIAMVFQSYALYPHLTVRDNLAFGLKLRKTPAAEIDARIAEASSMLGLDKFLARLPKQLSGGQRQRVAMGRAIVRRPAMFLFDEPLSNLDAALRAEVRVDIRKLHDRLNATTLYVTHDQVEAMTLADTLWVLNGGLVEQKGAPLEVYNHPKSRFVATFVGSPPMNMFEGVVERTDAGVTVRAPGLTVPLDLARFGGGAALTAGKQVTLGVRPHDFAPASGVDGAPVVGTFTVDLVEALGFEAFAYGTVEPHGTRTIVRLESHGTAMKGGESIALTIDAARVHLFDRETGLSLAS